MNSGNPVLNSNTFQRVNQVAGPAMTVRGAANKTLFLLALVIAGTAVTWNLAGTPMVSGSASNPTVSMSPLSMMLTFGGAIGGLILALVICFKSQWAPVLAPVYAILEGLFLGGISAMYNAQFQGIVLQAVMLTFGVMAAMLFLYQSRIIVVTQKFRAMIFAATLGIALFYLVTMVLRLFGMSIPMMYDGSALGIGISVFIVAIAALNLVLDFDMIEQGAAAGAPKYMEWYGAFGLMVTLIWLYLEILRLLARLQRR